MSRINGHSARARGFTLVELMISLSLLAIVLGGVLAAYLFLGRNLARMVNVQAQQVQSRRLLRTFTQDLSTASALTTASSSAITLSKPVSSGTVTVYYVYDAASGKLFRTEGTAPNVSTTPAYLSKLTAFTFSYYNAGGTAVSSSLPSIKTVEFSFTSAEGSSANATLTRYASVSPRVVLRNKAILQ